MRTSVAAVAFAFIALTLIAPLAPARADTFPSRPITLIVPFPPGGSTDVAARIMADKMGASLGQPVIVENVGGAGGSIGVGRLARATPDGYTIDIGQWDTHVGAIIYNINFDLRTDFAPIGLISINPMLLVAKKTLPADDLKSLVAYMKAHPGDAKFVNQNASAQVGGLLLQKLTGTEVLFVPYRGAGPAMTDLISGQVDLLLVQGAVALPQVRAGTIKALAELSPERSASMPDIPSAGESGVPGLSIAGWFGFYAPKGTPVDAVAKLNAAMVAALADSQVKARFAQLGLDVATREQQTPQGLAAFQNAEMDKWWPIIKAAGIRGE
ncbi:MAG TPA: tripartite tricarboxylate transporter substrate-binding protein [Xanthobacteraceae bacterium]|nr:tripartite tricarboxylate transporter substrate-binding protein [Xanthobacteraceae bacterium]